jgi:spore germination cell wall hydrolase CwlJ-like protein
MCTLGKSVVIEREEKGKFDKTILLTIYQMRTRFLFGVSICK